MADLVTTRCWCSVEHAVPRSLYELAQRDHKQAVFCPLGHQWVAAGETEADKQRRRAERAEQDKARVEEQLAQACSERDAAERSRARVAGDLKRHKIRASNGICPCCNRQFADMARHMKSKHPTYNVVPLKAVAS